MKNLYLVATVLLALPLIVFGSNYFLNFIQAPDDTSLGMEMLNIMREGGLMKFVALSHILVGLLLLYPKTRYAAALVQLPISLGIVLFHLTMMPAGTGLGVALLLFNIIILSNKESCERLLEL